MSLIKAQEAKDKRGKAVEEMRQIQKDYPSDKWNDEAQQKWDKAEADEKRFKAEAERYERMAKLESEDKENRELDLNKGKGEKETQEKRTAKYNEALHRYATKGANGVLSQEDRAILAAGEKRNNTVTGDGTQGGFLVPQGFSNALETIMKQYGGMMEVSTIRNTATGNDIPWPILNDTANVAVIIGEGATDTNQSLLFTNKTLKAYTYTSKMMPISMELLQDSYFQMQSVIAAAAGERMGRGLNAHFTTGTGTNQPEGVVTASTLGKTAGSATVISRAELVDLIHAVDRAYRANPSTRFMFHDTTLAAIKKLAFGSADDRPLWQPSMRVGEPDRLEGFSIYR